MSVEFNRYEQNNSGVTVSQCDVTGNDADEIVEALVPLIRPKSRSVCREYLRDDLSRNGRALINVHAGCGTHYTIWLEPRSIAPKGSVCEPCDRQGRQEKL